MDTVSSRISNVGKEAQRQFALDVKIPLLGVPVLLHGVSRGRKVVLSQDVLRDVRLRVAAGYGDQVVSAKACVEVPLVERSRSQAA